MTTKRISSARLRRAVANPTTSVHLPVPPRRADAKAAVRSLLATGALPERPFDGTKAQVIARLAEMVSGADPAAGDVAQQKCARAALEYVSSYGIKKARELVPLDPLASPLATRLSAAQAKPIAKQQNGFAAACDAARKGQAGQALERIALELKREGLTPQEVTALEALQATIAKHERVACALEEMREIESRAAEPAHQTPPINADGERLRQLVNCALLAGELDQARELIHGAKVWEIRDIAAPFDAAWDAVAERVAGASLDNVFPPTAGIAHVNYALDIAARMLLRPFARTRLREDPVFLMLPERIRALPAAEQERVWPRLIRTRMDLHLHDAAAEAAAALSPGAQRDGLVAEAQFAALADARCAVALDQLAVLARGRGAGPLMDHRRISARIFRGGVI